MKVRKPGKDMPTPIRITVGKDNLVTNSYVKPGEYWVLQTGKFDFDILTDEQLQSGYEVTVSTRQRQK